MSMEGGREGGRATTGGDNGGEQSLVKTGKNIRRRHL